MQRFLTTDVRPATDGRTSFHARVAANVLATVRRELLLGGTARAGHQGRLEALGCPDDDALSDAITAGSLDGRWEVRTHRRMYRRGNDVVPRAGTTRLCRAPAGPRGC